MHELKTIVTAVFERTFDVAALVTLVARDGSSYRKPGARMLVTEAASIGAVSGGCVESTLHRIARDVIREKRSRLVTIDTSSEDDLLWGYGLGCPGILKLLVEPVVASAPPDWVKGVAAALESRTRAVLVTEVADEPRRLFESGNLSCGDATLRELALDGLRSGTSANVTSGGAEFFVEVIDPPLSLLLFGGGDDAIPLTRIGSELGWETTVVDRRGAFARADRFPLAKRVIVAHAEALDDALVKSGDVAVITTHHYQTDLTLLRQLLSSDLRYIGVVGSSRRFAQLTSELEIEGDARLFGPAGLDIGSEGSAEIALSIAAQIRAVLSRQNTAPSGETSDLHPKTATRNGAIRLACPESE